MMNDQIQTLMQWNSRFHVLFSASPNTSNFLQNSKLLYVTSFCTIPYHFKTVEKSLFTAVTVACKACLGRCLM